ncbi:glycerol-3-phosphate dehydrogenase/oxidase [Caldalkalibacillus mannanilyticus]|uniref:glycerol-3-phosphate dehydrogenase/oxidase n=1 Tax=Caldalkalibacillus mannanilyticus TaxID=1418 RepID=UPI000468FFC6|nr:glycerol-3-phosphate dehydrogenase/oxidase [Caldalkalibacillus mannanilyticus]
MKPSFSTYNREQILDKLDQQEVDLLIIGGGITGCGIALDAVTRGLNTVLVEMQDFAAGTSSRSTKLVHGGLRYLKQFEVKMVAEVGKEREIVYENGPHVTTPEWMLLPLYEGGTFGKFSTSIGLRVYDFLAGVKKSERRKMLDIEEVQKREPLLKKNGLKGGGYYVEYKTDDARLTIEVVKEAVKHGAHAVNYAKVEEFIYRDGKVVGAKVVDQMNGKAVDIYAKKMVNAAGPWVDSLREKDRSKQGKSLQLTKGVHIVFDQSRFPLKQAIYFDTPDGRMVFAIPREGKTYVGTTDTVYKGDIANPKMSKEDRVYIINAINDMFPELKIVESDIESSWAGLRPLIHEDGKSPSEISRKDEIWQSKSGLITIAGGKLTGYRKMAEMVMDLVIDLLKNEGFKGTNPSMTLNMPISGGHVGGSTNFESFVSKKAEEGTRYGFTLAQAEALARKYGSNIDFIYQLSKKYDQEAKELDLPLNVFVTLLYSIEAEMTVKPIDYFNRRTGTLLFDIDYVYKYQKPVIKYMSKVLEWSEEQSKQYTLELEKAIHDAIVPQEPTMKNEAIS